MNQRLLCFIFVARKWPSLSMTCVHEKQIIDPKIAIIDMKRAFFSSLWIAFHGYRHYMTYWGPIKQWFSLVWTYQKILPKEIEENWNQSQTDDKKWLCLSSFNLRLKALISEVTVEQQILALVCYVSVALIRKIAKRTRILTFDWGH